MVSDLGSMVSNLSRTAVLLNLLDVDHGSAYTYEEMRSNVEAQDISLEVAPIETPGAIGTVERYHAPLRSAFGRIDRYLGATSSREHKLRLSVFQCTKQWDRKACVQLSFCSERSRGHLRGLRYHIRRKIELGYRRL